MAKITVKGLEEYANRLAALGTESEKAIREAVYAGAAEVADSIKAGLRSIPTSNERGTPEHPVQGVTNRQKADLIDAFGLAPIENKDGYVQTKAGFDGYGRTPSKKYPKGLPDALLMRSVESGTSFRKKSPVIRKAVNSSREKSIRAMGESIDKSFEEIMK